MFRRTLRQGLKLPDYNIARGGIYSSFTQPPFNFDGTMIRLFPLRARLERLQSFVDQFLNVVPQEAGHFRVYLPYVYLSFVYYGKLSLAASNYGWLSQYEVLFSIPLIWYKRVGGQLVFHDFATVAPFIYVDNDHSMTTGREVYGWPKDRISAESTLASWMADPEANPTVASFTATTFSQLYAGSRPKPQAFFQIRQAAGAALARWPFDPNADWLPWVTLPSSITNSVGLMQDYGEVLRGLGLTREQPGMGPDTYALMAARAGQMLRPYQPELVFNTLNLKQFRDATKPTLAAYQGLTNAPMKWKRISRGGLLGDVRLLQGDSSGGFTIDVYHTPTAPIVDLLGLEVAQEQAIGQTTIQSLRPVFPMWFDVDMEYNVAHTIAWRVRGEGWRDGQGVELPSPAQKDTGIYNNARGAADTEVSGPFEFPRATLRVMPLLADPKRLAQFLQEYLGDTFKEADVELSPWGRYVYLLATSYQEMSSATNDIGWWADRELVFHVPAQVKKAGTLWKLVLVPVYAYANSVTAAQTGAEVSGIPVANASIESTSNTWMDDLGAEAWKRRTLLKMSTAILPATDMGQQLDEQLLLEVLEGDLIPANQGAYWREIAQKWGQTLLEEHQRKVAQTGQNDPAHELLHREHQQTGESQLRRRRVTAARAFALQVLLRQRPLRMLTLKQFRDADDPTKACYQAAVEIQREITSVQDIEEIESGLYVRIQQYPTVPIVERLGLISVREEYEEGGVVAHVLEPIRPFWMRVSLREHLGRNLFVRTGLGDWSIQTAPTDPPPEPIGLKLTRILQYLGRPRNLPLVVDEWRQVLEEDVFESDEDLATVVETLEPQSILESILSEEWERWHECRWSQVQEELTQRADAAMKHKANLEAAKTEFEFFDNLLHQQKPYIPQDIIERSFVTLRELLSKRLLQCYYLRQLTGDYSDSSHEAYAQQLEATYKEYMKDHADVSFKLDRSVTAEVASRYREKLAELIELLRGNLLMFLARVQGKPHHVIRRDSIANPMMRERLFPRARSWNADWFVGVDRQKIVEKNSTPEALEIPPRVASLLGGNPDPKEK